MAPAERDTAAPGYDPCAEAEADTAPAEADTAPAEGDAAPAEGDAAPAEGDAAQDVGGAPQAPAPVVRRSKRTPAKAFMGRFMLGHLMAYPVGLVTAAAAIPPAMLVRKQQLMEVGARGATIGFIQDAADKLALTATEAAQVELVLGFSMWAAGFTLLLVHLWTLPWAIAAGRAVKHPERGAAAVRSYQRFKQLTAATFVLVAIGGVIGWAWVLTL